ncbi:MAG: tyrosine-type recombinase/integrase [Planctomycetes bacterium]|nr:tyrosine-type recombinase/integrase [Planctomycetota bacterium]
MRERPVVFGLSMGKINGRKRKMESTKTPKLYQKADGKWYCTIGGRQRYLGKDLVVANEKLAILLGKEPPRKAESIEDFCDAYLAQLINNQSPDTINTKRVTYKSFIEFVGARTSVRAISPETVEKYKQDRLNAKLKRQTVKGRMLNLSALFEHAVKQGLVKTNPVRQIARIKPSIDPNPDHLTEEEVAVLFELTQTQRYDWLKKRDKLLFTLMLYAGLRRIETANLSWPDLDFQKRLLVVRNGKGAKHRIVGLNDALSAALQDCWQNWKRSDEYVVTNLSGEKISRDSLTHITRKYVRLLNHSYQGRRRFSLHSLRATFATRLCERGVSTRIVQGLLGHADPRTTMRP